MYINGDIEVAVKERSKQKQTAREYTPLGGSVFGICFVEVAPESHG